MRMSVRGMFVLLLASVSVMHPRGAWAQAAASLPSETPDKIVAVTDSFDYVKRDVMIPMRDGVKLHTVILVPKGAKNAPILLTRTPYNASGLDGHAHSSHLGPILARV